MYLDVFREYSLFFVFKYSQFLMLFSCYLLCIEEKEYLSSREVLFKTIRYRIQSCIVSCILSAYWEERRFMEKIRLKGNCQYASKINYISQLCQIISEDYVNSIVHAIFNTREWIYIIIFTDSIVYNFYPWGYCTQINAIHHLSHSLFSNLTIHVIDQNSSFLD